jgi:LemA protein
MDSFEDKLNRHIDKVLEIQQNKETKPLTLEELKEVDLSLGMTEEEWEALMKRADDNANTAQSHFLYKNYSEAYKLAEQAVAINPYQEQAMLVMANAAIGIYEEDDEDDFLVKAKRSLNELLKINPGNHQAIELLAKVNSYKKQERAQKKKTGLYVIIALVVVGVIAGFLLFKPEPVKQENTALKHQLIELEENANARWAQVENVIARRDQMLPQLLELASPAADSENNLAKEIEDLNEKITQSNNVNDKVTLQAQLQDKIKALLASLNNKQTDEKVQMILVQIEGSYNRISVEGKRYNDAVKEYNIMVKKHKEEFSEFLEKAYFQGK